MSTDPIAAVGNVRTAHQRPLLASHLRRLWWGLRIAQVRLRFLFVLVVAFLIVGRWSVLRNYWDTLTFSPLGNPLSGGVSSDTEYFCPMCPGVLSEWASKCSVCNMPLVRRRKGEAIQLPDGVLARMQLSPYRVQLAGIRTEAVEYRPLLREVVASGIVVDPAETRLAGATGETSHQREAPIAIKARILERLPLPPGEGWGEGAPIAIKACILEHDIPFVTIGGAALVETDAYSGRPPLTATVLRVDPRVSPKTRRVNVTLVLCEQSTDGWERGSWGRSWPQSTVPRRQALTASDAPETSTTGASPRQSFTRPDSAFLAALPQPPSNGISFDQSTADGSRAASDDATLWPGMGVTVRFQRPIAALEPFRAQPSAIPELKANDVRQLFECPEHPQVVREKPGTCPEDDNPLVLRRLGELERVVWWCPMHPKVTASDAGHECHECSGMRLLPRVVRYRPPGQVLAVPEAAVIDTGRRRVVYLERMPGMFDGVEIEVGPRCDGYYSVIRGLEPGQRVAAAGAFLVDAETRLNPSVAASYFGASSRGVSSTEPAVAAPAQKRNPSAADATAIRAALGKLSPEDRLSAREQKLCPITGQPLGSMGTPIKIELQGHAVWLCCAGCEVDASEDPAATLEKLKVRIRAAK